MRKFDIKKKCRPTSHINCCCYNLKVIFQQYLRVISIKWIIFQSPPQYSQFYDSELLCSKWPHSATAKAALGSAMDHSNNTFWISRANSGICRVDASVTLNTPCNVGWLVVETIWNERTVETNVAPTASSVRKATEKRNKSRAHMVQKADNNTRCVLDNVHAIVILAQHMTTISCHLQHNYSTHNSNAIIILWYIMHKKQLQNVMIN